MTTLSLHKLGNNETEITTNGAVVLFSYDTPVAACIDGEYFKTSKKWSMTTSKHINNWCRGASIATEKDQSFFDELV